MIELSFHIEEGKTTFGNVWIQQLIGIQCLLMVGFHPKRMLSCQFITTHSLCGAMCVTKPLEQIILPTMPQFFAKRFQ